MFRTLRSNAFIAIICVLGGALSGFWFSLLTIYGPQKWLRTLYDWQTLTTGFLAILAATIGAFAARMATREHIAFLQTQGALGDIEELARFSGDCAFFLGKVDDVVTHFQKAPTDFLTDDMGNLSESKRADSAIANLLKFGFPGAASAFELALKLYQVTYLRAKLGHDNPDAALAKYQRFSLDMMSWCGDRRLGRTHKDFEHKFLKKPVISWLDLHELQYEWLTKSTEISGSPKIQNDDKIPS